MSYLLVESRDPFDSADVENVYELVSALADRSEGAGDVTVYLVQNGVLPTRRESAASLQLSGLASKATVLADEFSLRQRGIRADELADGVRMANIDDLVDLLVEDGRKVLWH